VMSHELKHPLNLIHLNAEMLMRLPETQQLPAVTRAGSTIRQAAANQAKIIDDLLDLSRINTGKLTLNVRPLDLRLTVEPIVAAAVPQARSAGVDLQAAVSDQPLVVLADAVRIEQITWNLLNNAIKFSPRGSSIRFELSQDGNEARLVVSDTGRGIDPAFLPQIFDMFSQERTRFSDEGRGLGIGLSLVHDLAQAHGGRVQADSAGLGKGAAFTVWLPLHDATPGTAGAQNGEAIGKLQGLRILLVDDSEDTLTVLGGLLRLEKAEVDAAASGAKALELLDQGAAYDLLISDLGMDEMDGCELIAAIRKGRAAPRIPAIALSGFGRDADVQRALAAGFDAHLSKPASVAALRETWQQVRDKR
jgi:two-component system CheB/CheR fusion protein